MDILRPWIKEYISDQLNQRLIFLDKIFLEREDAVGSDPPLTYWERPLPIEGQLTMKKRSLQILSYIDYGPDPKLPLLPRPRVLPADWDDQLQRAAIEARPIRLWVGDGTHSIHAIMPYVVVYEFMKKSNEKRFTQAYKEGTVLQVTGYKIRVEEGCQLSLDAGISLKEQRYSNSTSLAGMQPSDIKAGVTFARALVTNPSKTIAQKMAALAFACRGSEQIKKKSKKALVLLIENFKLIDRGGATFGKYTDVGKLPQIVEQISNLPIIPWRLPTCEAWLNVFRDVTYAWLLERTWYDLLKTSYIQKDVVSTREHLEIHFDTAYQSRVIDENYGNVLEHFAKDVNSSFSSKPTPRDLVEAFGLIRKIAASRDERAHVFKDYREYINSKASLNYVTNRTMQEGDNNVRKETKLDIKNYDLGSTQAAFVSQYAIPLNSGEAVEDDDKPKRWSLNWQNVIEIVQERKNYEELQDFLKQLVVQALAIAKTDVVSAVDDWHLSTMLVRRWQQEDAYRGKGLESARKGFSGDNKELEQDESFEAPPSFSVIDKSNLANDSGPQRSHQNLPFGRVPSGQLPCEEDRGSELEDEESLTSKMQALENPNIQRSVYATVDSDRNRFESSLRPLCTTVDPNLADAVNATNEHLNRLHKFGKVNTTNADDVNGCLDGCRCRFCVARGRRMEAIQRRINNILRSTNQTEPGKSLPRHLILPKEQAYLLEKLFSTTFYRKPNANLYKSMSRRVTDDLPKEQDLEKEETTQHGQTHVETFADIPAQQGLNVQAITAKEMLPTQVSFPLQTDPMQSQDWDDELPEEETEDMVIQPVELMAWAVPIQVQDPDNDLSDEEAENEVARSVKVSACSSPAQSIMRSLSIGAHSESPKKHPVDFISARTLFTQQVPAVRFEDHIHDPDSVFSKQSPQKAMTLSYGRQITSTPRGYTIDANDQVKEISGVDRSNPEKSAGNKLQVYGSARRSSLDMLHRDDIPVRLDRSFKYSNNVQVPNSSNIRSSQHVIPGDKRKHHSFDDTINYYTQSSPSHISPTSHTRPAKRTKPSFAEQGLERKPLPKTTPEEEQFPHEMDLDDNASTSPPQSIVCPESEDLCSVYESISNPQTGQPTQNVDEAVRTQTYSKAPMHITSETQPIVTCSASVDNEYHVIKNMPVVGQIEKVIKSLKNVEDIRDYFDMPRDLSELVYRDTNEMNAQYKQEWMENWAREQAVLDRDAEDYHMDEVQYKLEQERLGNKVSKQTSTAESERIQWENAEQKKHAREAALEKFSKEQRAKEDAQRFGRVNIIRDKRERDSAGKVRISEVMVIEKGAEQEANIKQEKEKARFHQEITDRRSSHQQLKEDNEEVEHTQRKADRTKIDSQEEVGRVKSMKMVQAMAVMAENEPEKLVNITRKEAKRKRLVKEKIARKEAESERLADENKQAKFKMLAARNKRIAEEKAKAEAKQKKIDAKRLALEEKAEEAKERAGRSLKSPL